MRSIGRLPAEKAAAFGDFLYAGEIQNEVEAEDDSQCSIWVLEDEQVATATSLLQRFRENPDAPEFANAATTAKKKRALEEKREKSRRSTIADSARLGYERNLAGLALLPAALTLICLAVAIVSRLGEHTGLLRYLFIADFVHDAMHGQKLSDLRAGQVWRLVTPIFIHFGILHLLFNMMWLNDLGGMIERELGVWYLAALLVALAVFSNLGQYFWAGPTFGGMSGVNYGLFGFMWMKGKYDPRSRLTLHSSTVQMMIFWYFLCLTGMLGPIANTAHTVGLLAGMAWGFLTARNRFFR